MATVTAPVPLGVDNLFEAEGLSRPVWLHTNLFPEKQTARTQAGRHMSGGL